MLYDHYFCLVPQCVLYHRGEILTQLNTLQCVLYHRELLTQLNTLIFSLP